MLPTFLPLAEQADSEFALEIGSQSARGNPPSPLRHSTENRDHLNRRPTPQAPALTYVTSMAKVTYMEKTQVYLRKEELEALRAAAARSGRSVADVIRDAIRKVVLKPAAEGPIAIWDGKPRHTSVEHDTVYDEV